MFCGFIKCCALPSLHFPWHWPAAHRLSNKLSLDIDITRWRQWCPVPGGHTADMASSGDTRLNIKIRKYEKRDHDTVCRIFYNGLMENWVRVKVSTKVSLFLLNIVKITAKFVDTFTRHARPGAAAS